ncbi:FAD-binding protein, partial [Faecalibaculum rodentium]
EFASGIPGTVGGAIVMNAGAYDGETVDVLESVRWLDRRGNLHVAAGEELDMGYRHSRFSDEFGVIVDAVYRLRPGDTKAIEQRIDELTQKRWSKQPMEAASAGSTFKRPAGSFASKLIHESGLQGLRVGDAMVSEKHAGFLINAGEATCGEFLELVRQVQEKVESDSGIRLELEIRRPDAAADAARDAALRRQAETEMEEGEEQED